MGKIYKNYSENSEEGKALTKIKEWIGIGSYHCEKEHKRVEENAKFERGEQWSVGDAKRQEERERPALPLNSIHKLLNAVANREIMGRLIPKVFARGRGDEDVAELLDGGNQWQRDLSETEHEESIAFRKTCASGYGVMHKWFDPVALDGDGMIRDEETPIWSMLWDPMSRKQNLVDRRWHMSGKYVNLEDAEATFGVDNKVIKSKLSRLRNSMLGRDKDHYSGDEGVSGLGGTWSQIRQDKWMSMTGKEVFIVEAEWKEIQSYYRVAYPVNFDSIDLLGSDPDASVVVDPETGEQITGQMYSELTPDQQMDVIKKLLEDTVIQKYNTRDEFSIFLERYKTLTGDDFEEFHKSRRELIKYAVVIDDAVIDIGEREEGYTFEFITGFCFETRDQIEFYGMVDVAKAPQDFKNVFYSNLLSMYMQSPKEQLIIEEGALKDIQGFLNEYAKLSGVNIVPDGFVQGGRYMQLQPPRYPPMLETLVSSVENNVNEIFGLSSIEMNTQGDLRRVSGNVVTAAKAATNTLLAVLFDGLRRYRKRWGLLNVRSLMLTYSPQELSKTIGDSAQYLDINYKPIASPETWPDTIRYDVKVDESPATVTEQEKTVQILTSSGTLSEWVSAGHLPFDEALDLLTTIPKSVREKIKKARNYEQQIKGQIEQLTGQIQKQSQVMDLFRKYLQSQQGGGQILSQFDLVYALSDQMAEEKLSQQQQQQQPQEG